MVKVFCVTWNARGRSPKKGAVEKMLCPISLDTSPDILAFTIQELVPLSPRPFVYEQATRNQFQTWTKLIKDVLQNKAPYSSHSYERIKSAYLGATSLIVLAKSSLKSDGEHKLTNVKRGYSYAGTTVGNKGGVFIRFDLESLSLRDQQETRRFCFIGVHLAAHEGTDDKKNRQMKKIYEKSSNEKIPGRSLFHIIQTTKSKGSFSNRNSKGPRLPSLSPNKEMSVVAQPQPQPRHLFRRKKKDTDSPTTSSPTAISSADTDSMDQKTFSESEGAGEGHDFVVVFGDLNYRIEVEYEEVNVLEKIKTALSREGNLEEAIADLLQHDHLLQNMGSRNTLVGFQEPKINFPPSYKFKAGVRYHSGNFFQHYDLKRCPSWTDRIVFKASPIISVDVELYNWIPEVIHSDHKPIVALFDVG